MNQREFDRVAGELMELASGIENSKRPGYTIGSEDVLANFKRAAERAGVTTEQAWTVFFLKHIDAIVSIMTRPDLPVSEAAEGRFADAINYLRLGYGIYRERQAARPAQPAAPTYAFDHIYGYARINADGSVAETGDYGQFVPAKKMGA